MPHDLSQIPENKTNVGAKNIRAKNVSPLPESPSQIIGSMVRGYKIGVINGSGKIPISKSCGNAIIMTILSVMNNHIKPYQITL